MKTNKLIVLCCLFFLSNKIIGQVNSCPCNCHGLTSKPAMIISDDKANNRDQTYIKYKKTHLSPQFTQEIQMDLNALKNVFAMATGNVTGIRIYLAQEIKDELGLIFAPTKADAGGKDIDISGAYQQLTFGFPTAGLSGISDTDAKQLLNNYRNWFKKDIKKYPPLNVNTRSETLSLFYNSKMLSEFYAAINTGCLKDVVKGVAIKFVAYDLKEVSTKSGKPIGGQLLIHFVFKDCNNFPIDLNNCYDVPLVGDTDTALPCPDYCNGGIDH